jgi:hypothetical protein
VELIVGAGMAAIPGLGNIHTTTQTLPRYELRDRRSPRAAGHWQPLSAASNSATVDAQSVAGWIGTVLGPGIMRAFSAHTLCIITLVRRILNGFEQRYWRIQCRKNSSLAALASATCPDT